MVHHNILNSKTGRYIRIIILCVFVIGVVLIDLLPFFDGQNYLMDFGSFYASGLKLLKGENPYDPNSNLIFYIYFPSVGAGGKLINLNPPISAVIFQFITKFNPLQAMIVWQVISVILYIFAVILLNKAYKQYTTPAILFWAFSLAGFWHTLVLGQIYSLLLLFLTVGWLLIKKGKYVWAGVAISLLVAIKPNFGIWLLFLFVAGYYTVFFTSVVSCLAISLIPILLYGTNIYKQWANASSLQPETLILPGNSSIVGLTARFDAIAVGIVISGIALLGLLMLSKWRTSRIIDKPEFVSTLGIIASPLVSPISWVGYTIFLLPIFFSLKNRSPLIILSAMILSIPFQLVVRAFQTSYLNFVIFGWLYGWGILLLAWDVIRNTIITSSIQTN